MGDGSSAFCLSLQKKIFRIGGTMKERINILWILLLLVVLWVPEAMAITITTSYTLNAQHDNISAAAITGGELITSTSSGLGDQLRVSGDAEIDYSYAGIAKDSPDGVGYNKSGAEIWVSSFSQSSTTYFYSPPSSGLSSANLIYHITGASKIHLSFNYYGDAVYRVDNDYPMAGLSLSLDNNPSFYTYTFPPETSSLGQSFHYEEDISLNNSGDLNLRTWASSASLGPNGAASAGIRLTNITIEAVPVPIPPSVWLFGSGLVGFIGLKRFRRS
jgi:hypothetical protein